MLPVEHALPTPAGHHPWRTIAVVVAGIATLELLGLVVVGTALVAKPVAEKARAAASKPANAHKTPARPILPRRSIRVTVLNGNGIAGAAATEAARVRAHGYRIRLVGNAPNGGYAGCFVLARQVNFETIHNHEVLAERFGTVGELRGELDDADAAVRHTDLAAWLAG